MSLIKKIMRAWDGMPKHWCKSSAVAISGWLTISKICGNGISSLVGNISFVGNVWILQVEVVKLITRVGQVVSCC